jgi:hypothetical protein
MARRRARTRWRLPAQLAYCGLEPIGTQVGESPLDLGYQLLPLCVTGVFEIERDRDQGEGGVGLIRWHSRIRKLLEEVRVASRKLAVEHGREASAALPFPRCRATAGHRKHPNLWMRLQTLEALLLIVAEGPNHGFELGVQAGLR